MPPSPSSGRRPNGPSEWRLILQQRLTKWEGGERREAKTKRKEERAEWGRWAASSAEDVENIKKLMEVNACVRVCVFLNSEPSLLCKEVHAWMPPFVFIWIKFFFSYSSSSFFLSHVSSLFPTFHLSHSFYSFFFLISSFFSPSTPTQSNNPTSFLLRNLFCCFLEKLSLIILDFHF